MRDMVEIVGIVVPHAEGEKNERMKVMSSHVAQTLPERVRVADASLTRLGSEMSLGGRYGREWEA